MLCGDLLAGDLARLMGTERASVVYSDPPWGPGNLQYWATMHQRGSAPRASWSEFLEAFCRAVAAHSVADAAVFVEMGMRWVDDLARAMLAAGRIETTRWTVQYGSPPRPNALWYSGPALPAGFDPTPLNAAALPLECLRVCALQPDALVLDPCCGKGYTARAAHSLGLRFRGLELNPPRLAHTAKRLNRRWARG